jgi:uncharacterized RDD family membrane protein YckC
LDRDHPADPYSPPGSDVNAGLLTGGQGFELAEPGVRLWAVMIDGLLISLPLLPVVAVGIYFGSRADAAVGAAMRAEELGLGPRGDEATLIGLGIAGLVGGLGALAVAIYQWVLISRTGQTLGKKWTGIRIERIDGARLTFGTGVFLRNWIAKLVGSVPYLGAVFHLVDCLFIFRDDRRCIHDHIAGTRVVRGSPTLPRSGFAGRSPATPTPKGEPWEGSPTLPRSGFAGRSPATPTRR